MCFPLAFFFYVYYLRKSARNQNIIGSSSITLELIVNPVFNLSHIRQYLINTLTGMLICLGFSGPKLGMTLIPELLAAAPGDHSSRRCCGNLDQAGPSLSCCELFALSKCTFSRKNGRELIDRSRFTHLLNHPPPPHRTDSSDTGWALSQSGP